MGIFWPEKSHVFSWLKKEDEKYSPKW